MKEKIKSEAQEQTELFTWIRSKQIEIPELQLAFSTLNGVRLSPKLRKEVKAQGMRAGVPDVILPVVTASFPGLYIEMKRIKFGAVSPEQKVFIRLLKKQGYRVEVAKGKEQAKQILLDYLGVEC